MHMLRMPACTHAPFCELVASASTAMRRCRALLEMADDSLDGLADALSPSPPPPEPSDGQTTFSDDPVEHSTLAATFMVMLLVTWLIFGHKIQGMFHWCVPSARHITHAAGMLERPDQLVEMPCHLVLVDNHYGSNMIQSVSLQNDATCAVLCMQDTVDIRG